MKHSIIRFIILCIVLIFMKGIGCNFTDMLPVFIVGMSFLLIEAVRIRKTEKGSKIVIVKGKIVSKRVDTQSGYTGGFRRSQVRVRYLYILVIEDENNNRLDIVVEELIRRDRVEDIYNIGDIIEAKVKKYKDSNYYWALKKS